MTTTRPNASEHAMVLSGGGANGAYGVGVMEALFSGRCRHCRHQATEPSIFTGTSVGAFNAAVMASLFDRSCLVAVRSLRKLWVEQVAAGPDGGNGVLRLRGNPFGRMAVEASLAARLWALMSGGLEDAAALAKDTVQRFLDIMSSNEPAGHRLLRTFHAGNLISSTPLRQLIAQTVDPRRLLDPQARTLRVIATNWDDGKAVVFYNRSDHKLSRPTVANYESIPLTERNTVGVIQASAAIPGLLPEVAIGDHLFVDGGVTMNSPFHPAIKAGASVLHVIHFAPELDPLPFGRVPSLIETLGRMAVSLPAGEVASDLVSSRQIRTLRRAALHLQGFIDKLSDGAPPLEDGVRSILREYAEKPRVSVHVYHPSRGIGGIGGLLDFRRERVIRLIEMGYEDTVGHDCETNGCVV